MVNEKYSNAYAEVLYYLKGIDQKYVEKIPKKLIEFFEKNANDNYECDFDYNLPLNQLNLTDETLGLIGMICLNYWCDSSVEKSNLENVFKNNEEKYQAEIREKFNPNNVLKKTKQEENIVQNEVAMVEYKESILKKMINKIKGIFHR